MRHIIFFHGGAGQEDFDADAKLVDSLKANLGTAYSVHYPLLHDNGTPDLGRREQIDHEISTTADNVILVGHSLGASMLLAYLSENPITRKIRGVLLIATPFWSGTEDWVRAFKLMPDFAERIDKTIPLFLYHCLDDEEVPFDHLHLYRRQLSWASFREIKRGGHQLNNDLTIVASDIKAL